MNFSKALLSLAASLIVQIGLIAQDHVINGYYISLKGDTVTGTFSNLPEDNKSPGSLSFQPAGLPQPISLSADNCLKFSAGTYGVYIPYVGPRMVNPTNYHFVRENSKDVYEQVSLFIKELFNDGHYRLYELADKDRVNFFAASDSLPLKELYYRVLLEDGNVIPSNGFRQQLALMFPDSLMDRPGVRQAVEDANYTEAGLVMIFTKITTGKRIKIRSKNPAQFFAGIGASTNFCQVKGTLNNMYTNEIRGVYSTQTSPLVEVGLKKYGRGNLDRVFLMFRMDAYSFSNYKDFTFPLSKYRTTFSGFVLGFPISIGYKLIKTPYISLDLSAGAAGLILLDNKEKQNIGNVLFPGTNFQIDDSGVFSFSATGEAALVWKERWSVYYSYFSPTQINQDQFQRAKHSSIEFGLRYKLF